MADLLPQVHTATFGCLAISTQFPAVELMGFMGCRRLRPGGENVIASLGPSPVGRGTWYLAVYGVTYDEGGFYFVAVGHPVQISVEALGYRIR
jgi:hypothetical protein